MQKQDLDQFRQIVEQLLQKEKSDPIVEPIPAEELWDRLDLRLKQEPMADEQFYHALEELVYHTPRTASKKFFNQLFAGRKSKSVLGDLLSIVLNNSMYTYKVAGPMVGVEKEIIHRTADLLGYGSKADGTIVTGGSLANFMGMVMGRDRFQAEIRDEGVSQKMTLYTSEDCHYSIAKNASLMGVGRNQVRFVKTDDHGRMNPADLKKLVEEDKQKGYQPFLVNVTAGTTVMGAFDSIPEVSEICKAHNLWLHIDGAYCGAVIFSKEYKRLVDGVELADSFNVNAHKMLGTPLTCSVLIAKDKVDLNRSFSTDADYLYQTDGDDFNLGKTSLQCGRKNDALKLWTLWKSVGTSGLEKMVDHQFHLANVARDYLRAHPDYTLYSYDDSVSVCFNYKGIDPKILCTRLYEEAALMVGYGSFRDDTFVRFVTVNADNSADDIIAFFKDLEAFVEQHEAELMGEQKLSAS